MAAASSESTKEGSRLKDMKRAFQTPPISNSKLDSLHSVDESYKSPDQTPQIESHNSSDNLSSTNSQSSIPAEEIERELNALSCIPEELSKLIDNFISDLKQPKYVRPLTILQLSSIFQGFYGKFDRSCLHYLSSLNGYINIIGNGNLVGNNASGSTFMSARETLSSGLSGIFARSRSSSGSSARRIRRSSSLLSLESNNATPMLSPEEITKQLRLNELNNLKVEKLMEMCEKEVFSRILIVGMSVSNTNENLDVTPKGDRAGDESNHKEKFQVSSLFKNSSEFIDYDKLLDDKIKCLSNVSATGRIDLKKFLDVPSGINEKSNEPVEILRDLVCYSISPCEKTALLLRLHDAMSYSKSISNDEFLSQIIYYIIKAAPKNIFLTTQFIKLFRYKKKLVENELYVLTNLEAALIFIDSLTVMELSEDIQNTLTDNEKDILAETVSSRISLPNLNTNDNQSVLNTKYDVPDVVRSNSYEGIKSVFDTSLRNIFGKLKTYTPGSSLSETHLDQKIEQQQITPDAELTLTKDVNSKKVHADDKFAKYKNSNFEDLSISELKAIFEHFQTLIE